MRDRNSMEEMDPKSWLDPMELRRGVPWGSLSPGNVRVVAWLHTLPSFSLWISASSQLSCLAGTRGACQHFYGASHCGNGTGETE